MNARKIREDLGRAKTSCQRNDLSRAIYLTISAFRELGGQNAPTDLRGDFRTTLAALASDPQYKKECGQALAYQPGKERELLALLINVYKELRGQEDQEDYETTLQRKLNLDRCLKDGKLFLKQGKPSEADTCFAEALKYYKNEYAAFAVMARAMLEAGEYVRALGHVRRGLKVRPEDAELRHLAEECLRLRAQAGR
ncbi:tetratricopeptide repeat protein [Desulfovibrio sp. SGI.169]|uniref:tetratricopeptide repeat protein n=1 Tax=Desulfovibrio sp. SGI.169 TaxID=3420561 RepID=UPI003D03D93C